MAANSLIDIHASVWESNLSDPLSKDVKYNLDKALTAMKTALGNGSITKKEYIELLSMTKIYLDSVDVKGGARLADLATYLKGNLGTKSFGLSFGKSGFKKTYGTFRERVTTKPANIDDVDLANDIIRIDHTKLESVIGTLEGENLAAFMTGQLKSNPVQLNTLMGLNSNAVIWVLSYNKQLREKVIRDDNSEALSNLLGYGLLNSDKFNAIMEWLTEGESKLGNIYSAQDEKIRHQMLNFLDADKLKALSSEKTFNEDIKDKSVLKMMTDAINGNDKDKRKRMIQLVSDKKLLGHIYRDIKDAWAVFDKSNLHVCFVACTRENDKNNLVKEYLNAYPKELNYADDVAGGMRLKGLLLDDSNLMIKLVTSQENKKWFSENMTLEELFKVRETVKEFKAIAKDKINDYIKEEKEKTLDDQKETLTDLDEKINKSSGDDKRDYMLIKLQLESRKTTEKSTDEEEDLEKQDKLCLESIKNDPEMQVLRVMWHTLSDKQKLTACHEIEKHNKLSLAIDNDMGLKLLRVVYKEEKDTIVINKREEMAINIRKDTIERIMQEIVADRHNGNEKLRDIIGGNDFKEIMKELYKMDFEVDKKDKKNTEFNDSEERQGIIKYELDVKKQFNIEKTRIRRMSRRGGLGKFTKKPSVFKNVVRAFKASEEKKPEKEPRNEKDIAPKK